MFSGKMSCVLVVLTSLFFILPAYDGFSAHPDHIKDGVIITIESVGCVLPSPNPSFDCVVSFTPKSEGAEMRQISVKDLNGNTVFSQTCNTNVCTVNFSGLGVGQYGIFCKTTDCESSGVLTVTY